MASAFPLMSSEAQNRLLECAVCLNVLDNHRSLPCQHSFCQTCLEPLVHAHKLDCPVCREVCHLKDTGISGLPKNVFIVGYLDQLCQNCKAKAKEIVCQHCQKHLCAVCHQACLDVLSQMREQLVNESERALASGNEHLCRIQETIIGLHRQVSKVSEEIDESTKSIIDAILDKQKQMKQELSKISNREMDRRNKQFQKLSGQMGKLKEFCKKTSFPGSPTGTEYDMLQKWEDEMKSTNFILKEDQVATIELSGCAQQIVEDISTYSSLIVKHKSITEDETSGTTSDGATENSGVVQTTDYLSKDVPQFVFDHHGSQSGELNSPTRVAVSPVTGNIIVSDNGNNRIQVFTDQWKFVSEFGSCGTERGQFMLRGWYNGIAVTPQGLIIVADTGNNRLQIFTEQGQLQNAIDFWGKCGPRGVSCDKSGNIYVCQTDDNNIKVIRDDGTCIAGEFGTGNIWKPVDVCICPNGDVAVADRTGKIEIFTESGLHKASFTADKIKTPCGITVDVLGNIIVTDIDTYKVHVFDRSGALLRSWGGKGQQPGKFCYPIGLGFTKDGRLLVVDKGNHNIQIY